MTRQQAIDKVFLAANIAANEGCDDMSACEILAALGVTGEEVLEGRPDPKKSAVMDVNGVKVTVTAGPGWEIIR